MHTKATFVISVALLAACGGGAEAGSATTPPVEEHQVSEPADTDETRRPCGDGPACAATEICVPGGMGRNGIGAPVHLGTTRCAPLPESCGGTATCPCVDSLCPIGGCTSVAGGMLECVAG